ncbi:MAG: isoprenylcysteine carboxylmethyltransferase family protein [Casimicrobiaceae bacterium]
MWLSWMVYWWAQSRNVKVDLRREPWTSRLLHILPLAVAVLLFSTPRAATALLAERFLPAGGWPFWIGSLLTGGGLLFAVWARLHLGKNWSGTVTIKKDHQLVTSGPYAIVRHPIYTGLLLAFLGSALALGEWRGVVAFVLAAGALWRKLRFEERWMREQFGQVYQQYAQRVAALVPFLI